MSEKRGRMAIDGGHDESGGSLLERRQGPAQASPEVENRAHRGGARDLGARRAAPRAREDQAPDARSRGATSRTAGRRARPQRARAPSAEGHPRAGTAAAAPRGWSGVEAGAADAVAPAPRIEGRRGTWLRARVSEVSNELTAKRTLEVDLPGSSCFVATTHGRRRDARPGGGRAHRRDRGRWHGARAKPVMRRSRAPPAAGPVASRCLRIDAASLWAVPSPRSWVDFTPGAWGDGGRECADATLDGWIASRGQRTTPATWLDGRRAHGLPSRRAARGRCDRRGQHPFEIVRRPRATARWRSPSRRTRSRSARRRDVAALYMPTAPSPGAAGPRTADGLARRRRTVAVLKAPALSYRRSARRARVAEARRRDDPRGRPRLARRGPALGRRCPAARERPLRRDVVPLAVRPGPPTRAWSWPRWRRCRPRSPSPKAWSSPAIGRSRQAPARVSARKARRLLASTRRRAGGQRPEVRSGLAVAARGTPRARRSRPATSRAARAHETPRARRLRTDVARGRHRAARRRANRRTAGEDAVVAVGLEPKPPWALPYFEAVKGGVPWDLGDAPGEVALKPGERSSSRLRPRQRLRSPPGARSCFDTPWLYEPHGVAGAQDLPADWPGRCVWGRSCTSPRPSS